MEEIIRFVYEEELFLIANEVVVLKCFHYKVNCYHSLKWLQMPHYVTPPNTKAASEMTSVFPCFYHFKYFAAKEHQDILIGEGCRFISYKKVLAEMASPFCDAVELVSFHSASKGFMGE